MYSDGCAQREKRPGLNSVKIYVDNTVCAEKNENGDINQYYTFTDKERTENTEAQQWSREFK